MVSPSMKRPSRLLLLFAALSGYVAAPSAEAAHDGARLYAQHCAACHGADGKGGVGVPLALPGFLATAHDDYLKQTIRAGRPGRVMPAFQQLSEAEVNAIVAHVRGFARAPAARPVRAAKGNAARGRDLYAKHCASCHGANGEGAHGTGVTFSRPRDYPILAPALNNPGFLRAASDAMIKATLVHGREGTPMRSFLKAGLRERDIDDIVAHVRAFERQPPPASATLLEAESPVIVRESEHDIQRTLDRLKTAVGAANMRLIRVVPFEEGIVEKGKEHPKRWLLDACDFAFLNKALAVDPRVGLFLPCRFTVVEHNGKVQVMAVNPKRLSAIFNNAELNDLCTQMHETYTAIIEEAVL